MQDNTTWREELLRSKVKFNKKDRELLTNGPKSFSESLYLKTIYSKFNNTKTFKKSSIQNLNSSIKKS
tara:strand:+ start:480 stop:683 length:204 start_codon:yes stop_codon:yes gene_type:complete